MKPTTNACGKNFINNQIQLEKEKKEDKKNRKKYNTKNIKQPQCAAFIFHEEKCLWALKRKLNYWQHNLNVTETILKLNYFKILDLLKNIIFNSM